VLTRRRTDARYLNSTAIDVLLRQIGSGREDFPLCVAKRKLQRAGLWTVDTAAPDPNSAKMAECELTLRRESKVIGLCRLAVLRLCSGFRLFISFRGKFLCYGLLHFLGIHSVAFGGIHENVVAAGGGSLIRRIEQADFQNHLAKFGLIIRAYLLGQKPLRGRGVLLCLYLVPLRQSRDLAVGEMADQVMGDR